MKTFKIGITNIVTGKTVKEKSIKDEAIYIEEKEAFVEKVLKEAEKMSKWFDNKDTFFSGKPIWECWNNVGFANRIENFVRGETLQNFVYKSIVVFPESGGRGIEHEFFIEEKRR